VAMGVLAGAVLLLTIGIERVSGQCAHDRQARNPGRI
jgi:hypothetical protein